MRIACLLSFLCLCPIMLEAQIRKTDDRRREDPLPLTNLVWPRMTEKEMEMRIKFKKLQPGMGVGVSMSYGGRSVAYTINGQLDRYCTIWAGQDAAKQKETTRDLLFQYGRRYGGPVEAKVKVDDGAWEAERRIYPVEAGQVAVIESWSGHVQLLICDPKDIDMPIEIPEEAFEKQPQKKSANKRSANQKKERTILAVEEDAPPIPVDFIKIVEDEPQTADKPVAVQRLESGGLASEPEFVDQFGQKWDGLARGWTLASDPIDGNAMSPERCGVTLHPAFLKLIVKAAEPFQGAAIVTSKEFGWGRWIAKVLPPGEPGVVTSIRTQSPGTPAVAGQTACDVVIELLSPAGGVRNEAHLEIRGPDGAAVWEENVPMNRGAQFLVWGFDIMPDRVVFHVDGIRLRTWIYSKEHAVVPGYKFVLSATTRKEDVDGPPKQDAQSLVSVVKFYPLGAKETE